MNHQSNKENNLRQPTDSLAKESNRFSIKVFFLKEQTFVAQIWCLCSLSLTGYLLTLINAINQISDADFSVVSQITSYTIGIQLIVIIGLHFVVRHPIKKTLNKFLIAVILVINFYSFHIVFIENFSLLSTSIQITLFLVSIFVAFQFLSSVGEFKMWRNSVIVSLALTVGVLSVNLFQYMSGKQAPIPDDGQTIVSPNIQAVDFKSKPNVYLLSFDALSAPSVIRSILEIDQVGFQQTLDEYNFRWFKNAFSDARGTSASLNRLLALHSQYYDELADQNLENSLYVGLRPSPVFQIFQHNGYVTATYSRDNYFGRETGPYTDYRVGHPFALCHNHLPETAVSYGYFGYCQIFSKEWFIDFFISEDEVYNSVKDLYTDVNIHIDFILEDWEKKRKLGKPLLLFSYVISPVHIPRAYKGTQDHLNQYRQHFTNLINNQTTSVMERMIGDIIANDPTAIIFVFGDHGTGISHPILSDKIGEFINVSQSIKNLSVWSQLGVASAIYPADLCTEYLSQDQGSLMEKYALNSIVVRQLIRCLAGGKDPIIGDVDYRIYSSKTGLNDDAKKFTYPKNNPGRYEDYLYEFPNRMTNIVIPVLPE